VLLLYGDNETESGAAGELLAPERLSRLYRHPIRRIATDEGAVFAAL
jgi:hypothetical protein